MHEPTESFQEHHEIEITKEKLLSTSIEKNVITPLTDEAYREELAELKRRINDLERNVENTEELRSLYKQGLSILELIQLKTDQDYINQAMFLHAMACTYSLQDKQPSQAVAYYKQAIDVQKLIQQKDTNYYRNLARLQNNLAICCKDNKDESFQYCVQAWQDLSKAQQMTDEDYRLAAIIQNNIANHYERVLCNYLEAIGYYCQAITSLIKIQLKNNQTNTQFNIYKWQLTSCYEKFSLNQTAVIPEENIAPLQNQLDNMINNCNAYFEQKNLISLAESYQQAIDTLMQINTGQFKDHATFFALKDRLCDLYFLANSFENIEVAESSSEEEKDDAADSLPVSSNNNNNSTNAAIIVKIRSRSSSPIGSNLSTTNESTGSTPYRDFSVSLNRI